jgi:hypothetical protein
MASQIRQPEMRLRLETLTNQGKRITAYRRQRVEERSWEFVLCQDDEEISAIRLQLNVHALIQLDAQMQREGIQLLS